MHATTTTKNNNNNNINTFKISYVAFLVVTTYGDCVDGASVIVVCVMTHAWFLYSVLDDKAGRLRDESKLYQSEARFLNLRASVAAKVAVAVIVFLLLLLLRYFIY